MDTQIGGLKPSTIMIKHRIPMKDGVKFLEKDTEFELAIESAKTVMVAQEDVHHWGTWIL
jgi:hypothetical protein